MSKRNIYINLSLISAIIIVSLLLLWQVSLRRKLDQSIFAKSKELKISRSSQKNLERLKSGLKLLENKEKALNKMIPKGEEQPLGLIKSITKMGNEMGVMKIDFDLMPSLVLDNAGGDGSAPVAGGAKELYFTMHCEATFVQFLKFLDKLTKLERVVDVRGIKIERDKDILPYQKISLELVTYSF